MGRLWLVLAVVLAIGGTALAKRDPPCTCATPRVLPAPGSVDVPTNARLWRLPSTSAPDQPIASYALAPHTHYEIRDGGTSFTTGAGPDDSAPVEPGIAMVSITLAGSSEARRQPVAILDVTSMMDSDVAVVRLTFADALGEVTYYTTPDALSVCDPGIELTAGPVRVTLTALDLAGHASLEQTLHTTAYRDSLYHPSCRPVDSPIGMVFFLAPIVGALALLLLLVVIASRTATARAKATPEPIAIASSEYLARGVRRRGALTIAAIAAAIGVFSLESNGVALACLGMFAILPIARWWQAHRFLRLLAYDGVQAVRRHDRVTITVGNRVVHLHASPSRVERAQRHALPKATL